MHEDELDSEGEDEISRSPPLLIPWNMQLEQLRKVAKAQIKQQKGDNEDEEIQNKENDHNVPESAQCDGDNSSSSSGLNYNLDDDDEMHTYSDDLNGFEPCDKQVMMEIYDPNKWIGISTH